jgi:hypothetical protein
MGDAEAMAGDADTFAGETGSCSRRSLSKAIRGILSYFSDLVNFLDIPK